MTDCQSCTAPAGLFLCERCIEELRADLTSLAQGPYIPTVHGRTASGGQWHIERRTPGLLANLNDVIVRQTRTGNGGGHRKRGDEMAGLYEPDTEKGKPTRQGQASALLNTATNTLGTIVRDVYESRGIPTPPRLDDTSGAAHWLAIHVHALACDEAAGQWKREITALACRIRKLIDRPPAPRFCGQCDTMIDRKMCRLMLYAHRDDATEITCTACRTVHNIEQLYARWVNSIDFQILPKERIIGNQRTDNPELYDTGIMGTLNEFVSWQQFNRWVRDRHLKPIRYLRPGGRRGFHRHGPDDIPEYRVGDVRQVRRRMGTPAKPTPSTGGNHKNAGASC